jgi:acyl-CoA thioesterase-1
MKPRLDGAAKDGAAKDGAAKDGAAKDGAANDRAGKRGRSSARKLLVGLLALLMLGMLVGRVIMGRLCTDAKPSARQNAADLPFFAGLPRVLNLAHRGASKQAPEHSLEAYALALSEGADVLELDLRLMRDGVLVVAHDPSLQRTLGLPQRWAEISWAEAQALAGSRAPPRLADVLRRFPEAHLNLELKDEDPAAARTLAEQLRSAGAEGRVLVASMHVEMLREFRRASQGAVVTSAAFREALGFYACYVIGKSCSRDYAVLQLPALPLLGIRTPGFIQHAHQQGLLVHYWTVDEEPAQRALLAAGADGIITNRPDTVARSIAAHSIAEQPGTEQAKGALASAPAIVFLGDSLTAGLGLPASEALPARIQQRLDAAGLAYHAINAGRSGDTTAGGLARLDWYFREQVDLKALVIGLGSNDAMRGLALDAMQENLRQIIRRTRQRKPSARIFLWALETFPNLGADYAGQYAAVFPRVAEQEHVTLIPFPLADVVGHPELNQEDGIHPTAEGTELVAERIWAVLRPEL